MAVTYAEQAWLATISNCLVRKSQQNNRAKGRPDKEHREENGHQRAPPAMPTTAVQRSASIVIGSRLQTLQR